MAPRLLALLLGMILLMPTALAVEARGALLVGGSIRLPSNAVAEGPVASMLLGGTDEGAPPLQWDDFLLAADELYVEVWADRNVWGSASGSPLSVQTDKPALEVSETLRNVTVRLREDGERGYIGMNGTTLASLAQFDFFAEGVLRSEAASVLTSGGAQSSEPYGRRHYYFEDRVGVPHLLAQISGLLSFSGPGELKLMGPTLVITHDEGEMTIATGKVPEQTVETPGGPRLDQGADRWAALVGSRLNLSMVSQHPWSIALRNADVSWQGAAMLDSATGELETSAGILAAAPGPAKLEGTFVSSLNPLQDANGLRTKVDLQGDVESSNLVLVQGSGKRVLPGAGGGFPSLLLFGLAAVVGAAGGCYVMLKRKRPAPEPAAPPELAAEHYVGLAEQAIQLEDHEKALLWIVRAREAAPTSASVATTMAYVLGELGRFDEALAVYDEASRLDPTDGEADLNAARLAAVAGKSPDVVEERVARALERTPAFVLDVEEDPEFRRLEGRPLFMQAVDAAWRRWGDEEERPGVGL